MTQNLSKTCWQVSTLTMLLQVSIHAKEELEEFITFSKNEFDLRGWEYTEKRTVMAHGKKTAVFGLHWNRLLDILKVNVSWTKDRDVEKIAKCTVLAVAHKSFYSNRIYLTSQYLS